MRIASDRKFLVCAALSLFSVFIMWSKAFAITEFKIFALDVGAEEGFGDSLSISGDVALVGAPGDDNKGNDSGAVYVFCWNGSSWMEEQ